MNKKFTLSLFLLLVMVIGLPSAFAQTIKSSTVGRSDSAMLIQASLRNNAVVKGYDSTSYTALSGDYMGFTIPTKTAGVRNMGSINITPNTNPQSAQWFLKFSDVGGTGFKYQVGDTIFLSFNSKNSNNRRRFKFDTTKTTLSFYVNNQGGAPNLQFKMIGKDNVPTADEVVNNQGTINLGAQMSIDTLRLLITAIPTSPNNTDIYLYNLYVAPADSFLQGNVYGVEDTLVVSYGRGRSANLLPANQGQRGPVAVLRTNHYWEYNPEAAAGFDGTPDDDASPSLSTFGATIGGAPLVKLRLLPGAANFVRWNVGVIPTNGNVWFPTGMPLRADGSLEPTPRRNHHRGRLTAGTFNPFRITDTTSINTLPYNAINNLPDTLYVLDADSNFVLDSALYAKTTLIGVDSVDNQIINRNSGCGTPYGVKIFNYTERPSRIIFNWAYEITSTVAYDRVRKMRMLARFSNLTNLDTLNSKWLEKDPTDGSFAISGNGKNVTTEDSTINIRPGLPTNVAAVYNSGAGWKVFPDSLNASVLGSTVSIRATMKDKCGNAIQEGTIGSYATGAFQSAWDTTITQGIYVWGPEPNIKPRSPYYPLTDTMFVFAKMAHAGEVEFRWKPENCLKGKVTFNFMSYSDSTQAVLSTAPTYSSTSPTTTYWLNILPNNTPAKVRLVTATSPVRTYYPIGDTTKAQTVDVNCARTIVPIKAYFTNSCGDILTSGIDTSMVTFNTPTQGGAAYDATKDRVGSYQFHTATSPTTFKYSNADDGFVYIDFRVPNTKWAISRISAYVTANPLETDEHYVRTYSGNPSKLLVKKAGDRDSLLTATRGLFKPTVVAPYYKTATLAYADVRDCNNEPFNGDTLVGTGTTAITWSLYGPAAGAASLFNPAAYYTLTIPNPLVNPGSPASITTRGTRTLTYSTTNGSGAAQGFSFIGICADTVGGKGVTKDLIFPIEKDVVFPAGTYTGDNVTKYADETSTFVSIPSTMASFRGYTILKVSGSYTVGSTVYPLTQSIDYTTVPSGRLDFNTIPDTVNQVAWIDGTGDKFTVNTDRNALGVKEFMAPGIYNMLNLYGRQAAPILDWVSTVNPQYKRLIIDTQNKSNTVTAGINSWTGGRNFAGNFVNMYVRTYDMFGNPLDIQDTTTVDVKVVSRKLNNPTVVPYQFGEAGYLNGRFTTTGSLSLANGPGLAPVNTLGDKVIETGASNNLRGSLKLTYQTTFANTFTGVRSRVSSTSRTYVDVNQADTVRFVTSVLTAAGNTIADTGIVRSMPTNNLANYKLQNPLHPVLANSKRVGDTLSYNWLAIDDNSAQIASNAHAVPTNARLWWYDYRVFGDTLYNSMNVENSNYIQASPEAITNTGVYVVADANTYSPLLTLYPNKITPITTGYPLTGQVWSRIAGATAPFTVTPGITGIGFDSLTTPVTRTSPFNTFTVVSETKRALGSGRNDAYTAAYWNNEGGFVLGEGRVDIQMQKAATYKFTLLDSASRSVVGDPTPEFKWLPGYIHWVSMVNPNAARPELEAMYPYPLRKNFEGTIQFTPTSSVSTPNPANENWVGIANPRSYATPVDTIFIGQHYDIQLRNYDRFGNRNTDDSIYVGIEATPGFWDQSLGSASYSTPVLLDQDTTGKTIGNVFDLLQSIPNTKNNQEFSAKIRVNYFGDTEGMMSGVINKPDLPFPGTRNSGILAFRDVYVKTLKAPGAFSITTTGAALVRLDNGDFTAMWTAAANTNLYDDSIKYVWHIKDLADATIATVDAGYAATSKTLTPAQLATALGLGPQHYNRTVKWYVVATNKWGLSTATSNTITTIFELNKKAETFALTSPGLPSNTKLVNSTATPLTLGWNVPVDSNGATDLANTVSITSYGVAYTLDTLTYKVVLTKVSDYPAGTGYTSATWEKVATIGNALTISVAELNTLLGTADSVNYTWMVYAKDRGAAEWTATDFVTASNVLPLKLTKIGTLAKILVGPTQNSTNPLYTFPVTDSVSFTLHAYDGDMNLIRGFNNFGVNLKLVPEGAKSSTIPEQKVTLLNIASGAYLVGDITNGFTLPSSAFVSGVATISYRNTKAGDTVQIAIPDANPSFKMIEEGKEVAGMLLISGDKTRKYVTTPGPVAKMKIEVMPRTGANIVYKQRAMEVVVTPTDMYKNEIVTLPGIEIIKISAKTPDNFIGTAWAGERPITGKSSYILIPAWAQNDQILYAYLADKYETLGQTAPFQILDHAPSAFTLTNPPNNSTISLTGHSQRTLFSWTKSTDPNNAELIKSVPTLEGKYEKVADADVITYSVQLVGNNNNYVLPDSVDTDELLNSTGTQLYNALRAIGGSTDQKKVVVSWKVIATDNLYQTISDARTLTIQNDGINKTDDIPVIPTKFAVGQNYPNPFNPTTNINYELPKAADVKIVIYNILGQPVRTLVNARQEASVYTITWDGKNDLGMPVSTGTYIYRVTAGEFNATKKMNLLK